MRGRVGHGSENHLRSKIEGDTGFAMRAAKACGLTSLRWMDYVKLVDKKKSDRELLGLEFLKLEDRQLWESVKDDYPLFWRRGSATQNWDAVGVGMDEKMNRVFVLCEAKAHLGELGPSIVTRKSAPAIREAFSATKEYFWADPDSDWVENRYYQMANRLFVVDFLRRHGIRAVSLGIFFYGNDFDDTPMSKAGWMPEIQNEYRELGLNARRKRLKKYAKKLFEPISR